MTDEELLRLACERFREAEEAESEMREESRKDQEFFAGLQWNEMDIAERRAARRPYLVSNRIPQFCAQVTNELRRNKPSYTVLPVDSNADPDTAEVIQGLLRHIVYNSGGDRALQIAHTHAVRSGYGYFRLVSDYCEVDSFDQEIRFKAIHDPFSVYCDPFAVDATRRDARYMFVVSHMSRDEFKRQWPNSETASTNFFNGAKEPFPTGWMRGESIQVAEYFWVDYERKTLASIEPTGATIFLEDVDELGPGVTVRQKVEKLVPRVRMAYINGAEVLERREWPGPTIPIFLVAGDEVMLGPKRMLVSLTRYLRDPQQLLNYLKTSLAEVVGLAPKSPYLAAEGQLEGYEQEWATANKVNHAYLTYRTVDVNGRPVPPPQRNTYEPPIQALSIALGQAIDDMKAAVGMYDAALGARSNETSGVAINARKVEGETATYHFLDNYATSVQDSGREIINVIPHFYDTPRLVRILGEDEQAKIVRLNQAYDDNGKTRHYKIGVGKYDVRVSTGPSYTTKREQAFDMLTEMGRSWPQLFAAAGDKIIQTSDIPGSKEIADRLKRTVPPELLGDEGAAGGEQDAEAKIAQMQGLIAELEQMKQALAAAEQELQSKREELESRERIATIDAQTRLAVKDAELGSKEALTILQLKLDQIAAQLAERRADEDSNGQAGELDQEDLRDPATAFD